MKFFGIDTNTKLSDLANLVGIRNVEEVLALNGVPRVPDIGQAFTDSCYDIINKFPELSPSEWIQRKCSVLNAITDNSDVFEAVALLDDDGWKVASSLITVPGTLKIPDSINVSNSAAVLGNGIRVGANTYRKVINSLKETGTVDQSAFVEYSTTRNMDIVSTTGSVVPNIYQDFKFPWGEITLYSSLSQTGMDFPVYPEEYNDTRTANYTTMPDIIYQYEPWQVYQSSGPRSNSYEFHFHRDMWTGDHRDGKANELIRFCEANCFPEFNGSNVNVPTVTLYVGGRCLINGVMTSVDTKFSGPIGLDKFPLDVNLTLHITEVSPIPLNFESVRNMAIIGGNRSRELHRI